MKQTNMTVMVLLNETEKVKRFVNVVSKLEPDCDLVRGRYTIDAKSIMGIFSLDLSKPLELCVHADIEDIPENVRAALMEFVVDAPNGSAI